ncbi:MAG: hypothetical protein RL656_171, partial [Bacteroidota bacterium]
YIDTNDEEATLAIDLFGVNQLAKD